MTTQPKQQQSHVPEKPQQQNLPRPSPFDELSRIFYPPQPKTSSIGDSTVDNYNISIPKHDQEAHAATTSKGKSVLSPIDLTNEEEGLEFKIPSPYYVRLLPPSEKERELLEVSSVATASSVVVAAYNIATPTTAVVAPTTTVIATPTTAVVAPTIADIATPFVAAPTTANVAAPTTADVATIPTPVLGSAAASTSVRRRRGRPTKAEAEARKRPATSEKEGEEEEERLRRYSRNTGRPNHYF